MMENLQMASPDTNGDESDAMSALDELGDMIRQQQDLRDRTFKQGQDQRNPQGNQQGAPRGQQGRPGQPQQPGNSMGELRQSQQALRDRLNKLLDELQRPRPWPGQRRPGRPAGPGPGHRASNRARISSISSAAPATPWAMPQGELGQGNSDSAVDSQGRALDALAQGRAGSGAVDAAADGAGPGPGRPGRLGQSRAEQDTDPLGRPLRGRDYGDDSTVKVPGEIDVQRARRIIEELRKRFGDLARPQEELDYIERLLKDY